MEGHSTRERRAQILQNLLKAPKVYVSQLSKQFSVSEVTIRKDLEMLEKRHLLIRVRGGAIRMPHTQNGEDTALSDKQRFSYREKRAIGQYAASLIKDNETIIIDSGSTTIEIAKNLHHLKNLTIITNGVNVAMEVSRYKKFQVILLGGHLRSTSLSTVGPLTENSMRIFYCDKLFLGVDSFSIEHGLSTPNIEEANINQTMITMAKEIIAVFDSSKFNKKSFAFITSVSKLNHIVTDSGIPLDIKSNLKALNIKTHVVSVSPD